MLLFESRDAFKISAGHGVGFAAVNPNARPRLHPKSQDVLEPGVVFNLEPAIYLENLGGLRHCDMVAVTADEPLVLTAFDNTLPDLLRVTPQ